MGFKQAHVLSAEVCTRISGDADSCHSALER